MINTPNKYEIYNTTAGLVDLCYLNYVETGSYLLYLDLFLDDNVRADLIGVNMLRADFSVRTNHMPQTKIYSIHNCLLVCF